MESTAPEEKEEFLALVKEAEKNLISYLINNPRAQYLEGISPKIFNDTRYANILHSILETWNMTKSLTTGGIIELVPEELKSVAEELSATHVTRKKYQEAENTLIDVYYKKETDKLIKFLIEKRSNGSSGQELLSIPKIFLSRVQIRNNRSSLMEDIRDYVTNTSGIITLDNIYKDLGVTQADAKGGAMKAISTVLCKLVTEGLLDKIQGKRGTFRVIQKDTDEIDYKSSDVNLEPILVKLPLGIHKAVEIYEKNIIVLAGETNSGKTAFIFETIYLNDETHKINLFTSESTDSEIKKTLLTFPKDISTWRFKAIDRTDNFEDVIDPDGFNIIDYIELEDKFYLIAGILKAIHKKLRKGICIVTIQKKPGRDTGIGGDFSKYKCRLYLSLTRKEIKFEKAKWTVDDKPLDGKRYPIKFRKPFFKYVTPPQREVHPDM